MCSKPTPHQQKSYCGSSLASAVYYEPPVLKENRAGVYIEFRAFDPSIGKLRRKTVKLNHIKGTTARRKYGRELVRRLSEQLACGWSPWISKNLSELTLMSDALDRYEAYVDKMYNEGLYRKETYVGYKSYLKIYREYVTGICKITFLYQMDRKYLSGFLDYVFIDRGCGAQTRNNYLGFLRVLSGYFVDKGLLDSRPTDGISPISKRLYQKERGVVPSDILGKISDCLKKNDPYFLSACYLLFYCFIRPVEMTRLRISDFNVKESTVTIGADQSKNRRTQTVTIPKKAMRYLIDLGVLSAPMCDYLFSEKLRPGAVQIDTKIFRDHWEKLRKELSLPKSYKFYSLKDSGIDELCESTLPAKSIRDQARHSSLLITDIYTRHDAAANARLIDHDGSL